MNEHISGEDFLIQISPNLDDDFKWTGQVEVNIISSDDSCLDKEEMDGLLFFCQMVCAAIPIYEDHESIREMASWIVNEKYAENSNGKLNGGARKAEIVMTEDNIIKVNFNRKKEH